MVGGEGRTKVDLQPIKMQPSKARTTVIVCQQEEKSAPVDMAVDVMESRVDVPDSMDANEDDCGPETVEEIKPTPVDDDMGGTVQPLQGLSATVEGKRDVVVLVDTGAMTSVLPASLARLWKVRMLPKNKQLTFSGIGGTTGYLGRCVCMLEVPTLTRRRWVFHVVEGGPPYPILGQDWLEEYQVELRRPLEGGTQLTFKDVTRGMDRGTLSKLEGSVTHSGEVVGMVLTAETLVTDRCFRLQPRETRLMKVKPVGELGWQPGTRKSLWKDSSLLSSVVTAYGIEVEEDGTLGLMMTNPRMFPVESDEVLDHVRVVPHQENDGLVDDLLDSRDSQEYE